MSCNTEKKVIKVGSRKSQLALIQTNNVIEQLKKYHPKVDFEVVKMSTTGDNILDRALSKIGEKNLFTRELEEALLDGRVDFVVHSLKDLPTVLPEGLAIGAVCKRDDPRDAVIFHPKHQDLNKLEDLPTGSILGTSSLRRGAQLKRQYPQLQLKDVRGNLNTRLRKLNEAEDYDALVLAVAGMERMNWHNLISEKLDPSKYMYAVGQGAMAVECRARDPNILSFLTKIHDYDTVLPCVAERSFLKTLEGGCSVPVSVYTELSRQQKQDKLTIKGAVFSIDGKKAVIDDFSVSIDVDEEDGGPGKKSPRLDGPQLYSAVVAEHISQKALQAAEKLGSDLAQKILSDGGEEILKSAKQQIAAEIHQENEERLKAAENGFKKTDANNDTKQSSVENGVIESTS